MVHSELLADIATRVVGEPVTVGWLDAEAARASQGTASWDGARYVVRLNPHLEPNALVAAFFHEVAHLALGHVRKGAPHVDLTTWPPALQQVVASLRVEREAAADAWAAAALKALAPGWRALLAALAAGGE